MTQKQSVIGRIARPRRLDVDVLIDQAADPETMLDQLIRDVTSSIADAEDATAVTIGLRMLEADTVVDEAAAQEVGTRAQAASARADALRASGQTADASTAWRSSRSSASWISRTRSARPSRRSRRRHRSSTGSRPVSTMCG